MYVRALARAHLFRTQRGEARGVRNLLKKLVTVAFGWVQQGEKLPEQISWAAGRHTWARVGLLKSR